jgi:hypothetical protein
MLMFGFVIHIMHLVDYLKQIEISKTEIQELREHS